MAQSKSRIWSQLIAAYGLNAACAWLIIVADECTSVLDVACGAGRWPYFWVPFLVALVIGCPALIVVAAAALMRARLTSALYFVGAPIATFVLYNNYLQYVVDAFDVFRTLLVFNLAWFPVAIMLVVLEAWLKKKIGKRPADASA
jgi:SAM-dependent methyltransferase